MLPNMELPCSCHRTKVGNEEAGAGGERQKAPSLSNLKENSNSQTKGKQPAERPKSWNEGLVPFL